MDIKKAVIPLAGKISPALYAAEDVGASGWVPVANFKSVMTIAQAGLLDSGALALTFEQAMNDDPEGAESKALSAWTGGTLSADGGDLVVDNDPAALDINGGFTFVRALLTANNAVSAAALGSLAMFGANPRHSAAAPVVPSDEPPAGPQEEGG